jgi:outer membrane protein assembly factor BamB
MLQRTMLLVACLVAGLLCAPGPSRADDDLTPTQERAAKKAAAIKALADKKAALANKKAGKLAGGKKGVLTQPSGPYWPQWRGPDRDGHSPDTGLLQKWPADGPPLAWKCDGMGAGFSSVSIAEDRIFCMGDRNGRQWLYALELEGGKGLWALEVGDVWDPNGYSGPRCTPTVDGKLVYALGTHGDLVCAEAATGAEVWRKNLKKDFGGKMHSGWGFSESPLVDDSKVICTPGARDATLAALNKNNGALIWKTGIPDIGDKGGDGAGYASIVIGHGADVRQYVQFVGRGVVGLSTDGGHFLWGYNHVANNTANIPTPLVHEDYVFCSSGYGTGAGLVHLRRAKGGVEADEVYFLDGKELQNHHGGMVMVGDYIYLGHGHKAGAPTCIEWMTGKRAWRKDRGPGSGSAGVTYADGNLYFRYEDGTMALIAADPSEYQERGKFKIPDVQKPSWPHPVITGGRLYLREQDHLYCYDIQQH